jgi:hypothetical protein
VANETPIAQYKGLSHFFGAVILNRTNTNRHVETKYPSVFKINTNPKREHKATARFLLMDSEKEDEGSDTLFLFLISKTARIKERMISKRLA